MSEQVKPYTREFYSKQIDFALDEIRNDKEKLLDIVMDKCAKMDIIIPLRFLYEDEAQHYQVRYEKIADFRMPKEN